MAAALLFSLCLGAIKLLRRRRSSVNNSNDREQGHKQDGLHCGLDKEEIYTMGGIIYLAMDRICLVITT